MPKPRKLQISLEATPFYNCVSRCVRRAFICGNDSVTGRSHEHRRQQIIYDLLSLASLFDIDVAAFVVMSNHYHVVLHVDAEACKNADPKDIVRKRHQLCNGKYVSRRYLEGDALKQHELDLIDTLIKSWRSRLFDISL